MKTKTESEASQANQLEQIAVSVLSILCHIVKSEKMIAVSTSS